MRELVFQRAFKTDFKKIRNDAQKFRLVAEVMELLRTRDELPPEYHEHPLRGKYAGTLECHAAPDLLVVYIRTATKVTLVRVGSHAALFK
ncbi:MAG: type II toxin-antitoxin system YafQ family toxin [Candidatus Spyradosoma sp.]